MKIFRFSICCLFICFCSILSAQTPSTINIQGVLNNASGQIIQNGSYSISFRLYADALGGSNLWEEKQDAILVQSGVFSALLGKVKPLQLPFDKTYFLSIQIGQDPEMNPRIELTSSPYSMMAKNIENNAVTTAKIQANAITIDKIASPLISSINGIINDGGDIKVKNGKNILITSDPLDKSISIGVTGIDTTSNDSRYVNENQANIIGQDMIKDNVITANKIIPNLVSAINNVSNDGGNISIVAGANISIINNDAENTITISAVNPGTGTAGIVKINPGTAISVAGQDGPTAVISVSPNAIGDLEITDKSLTSISLAAGAVGNTEIQTNAITTDKIIPNVLSSLSGVTNDGGNINLIAGANVSILPDDINKTITISATGTGGGGGGGTLLQLAEGNGIGIQNALGPIPIISIRPKLRLGPSGSLDILNENSLSVLALDVNNNSGGFLGIRNQEATEVIRMATLENRQPRIRISNRLGNPVGEFLANDFSDGTLNLFSVQSRPTLSLTANDELGGLINIFNPQGTIVGLFTSNVLNEGRLTLSSVDNARLIHLSTTEGGGLLSLYHRQGAEAIRLTMNNTGGGLFSIFNQNNISIAQTKATPDGDGYFRLSNRANQIILQSTIDGSGGGFLGLNNNEGTETVQVTNSLSNGGFVGVLNRLGTGVGTLQAGPFSDGEINLLSVLNKQTLFLSANDNAGGLINVFNQNGIIAARLTEDGGGYLGINNTDETEMISLSTLENRNARIRVNNRLGNPVADLMSNEFSDGELTLGSSSNNRVLRLTANDNAGGLINVYNINNRLTARLTEVEGEGNFKIFNTDSVDIVSIQSIGGDGSVDLRNKAGKLSAFLSFGGSLHVNDGMNDANTRGVFQGGDEGGNILLYNKNNTVVHNIGINILNREGLYSIASKSNENLDLLNMGGDNFGNGYFNLFNSKGFNTWFIGHNEFDDASIELKNNLGNPGGYFTAFRDGGSLAILDGKPGTNHRALLESGFYGGRLALFNKDIKLIQELTTGSNGEGLFRIISKLDLTKNRVEMGGDNAGAGYLKLFNSNTIKSVDGGSTTDGSGFLSTFNQTGKKLSLLTKSTSSGGLINIYNDNDAVVGSMSFDGLGGTVYVSNKDRIGGSILTTNALGGSVLINSNAGKLNGEMTSTTAGGELDIYNINGINTTRISNSLDAAGQVEVGASNGNKVARVTTREGAGYVSLDNLNNVEVVRITANNAKGGGIGIANQSGIDIINLTQTSANGSILVNNAAGSVLSQMTVNNGGGGFIGNKDHKAGDAVWLTTGAKGGGNVTVFNDLGKVAAAINHEIASVGNIIVNGANGNEIARMTGNGSGNGTVFTRNTAGITLAGLTHNTATNGGYIYANNSSGVDVARMTSLTSGGGHFSIDNNTKAAVAYLTNHNINFGGWIGVANASGNERVRMTTFNNGAGYLSTSNAAGQDIARFTYSGSNHGVVETSSASGVVLNTLTVTGTGDGYIRANNSAGNERAFMTGGASGAGYMAVRDNSGTERVSMDGTGSGILTVRDNGGNARVVANGGGNLYVNDVDGSYFVVTTTGSGAYLRLSNAAGLPRAEIKNGYISVKGTNGVDHSFMGSASAPNFGYIGVCNSAIPNSPVRAGMYVDANNKGTLFADVKNFKIDYPGKPDKQIWYGSLEGPELAAYIRGTATLTNGKSSVVFSDHYQKLANTHTMTVILTPLSGKSKGLAVVKKSTTGFDVEELFESTGTYDFDWEVKCVRLGHEDFEVVRDKKDEPREYNGAISSAPIIPTSVGKAQNIKAEAGMIEKMNKQ